MKAYKRHTMLELMQFVMRVDSDEKDKAARAFLEGRDEITDNQYILLIDMLNQLENIRKGY